VINDLLLFIPSFYKTERFLHNPKWVEDLCSDNKLELAYLRAKELADTGESYTHISRMLDVCGIIDNNKATK